jgi:ArsR family transcriptional regulator
MDPSTDRLLNRFKALADPVRVRLVMLCAVAECSVSELTRVTGLSQPRVSQHLKQLISVGLLERFRDGHFVYYRVPQGGQHASARRRLLALLPADEPDFAGDLGKLRGLRTIDEDRDQGAAAEDRFLHKALVELTVSAPLGNLLDIGCGEGRLLKLLASRAHRVVGVDIDPAARRLARAELLLAGLPNCSLRQGDMYGLPFEDESFDTIILDDVLPDAQRPADALREARRLLRTGGRMLMLATVGAHSIPQLTTKFAAWAADTGLRLAPPRPIPEKKPGWLLGVATP